MTFFQSLSIPSLILATVVFVVGLFAGAVFGILLSRSNNRNAKKSQQILRKDAERAVKAERERIHAIYNVVSTLTASLNYQRVLDNALDLSTSILRAPNAPTDRLVSAVLLFSGEGDKSNTLSVGSARRITPADSRIKLPGSGGLIAQAIETGYACMSRAIAQDPELCRFVALRGCSVVYCIPLHVQLDTYGVMLFAHPEPDYFNPQRREILDIIGHQAVIAIQNARLYHDLEQEKERMTEIQEEARKKLARDLHDGPTQTVAAIAMRINFARRMMDRDVKVAADELYKIEDMARRATKEIRHMLFTLRPLVLESQGLVAALETMAEKTKETYNQKVVIEADPNAVEKLEMTKQTVVFYIVEEAVNNARKHAQAETIWVRLKAFEEQLVLLEIEDNGVGFDLQAVDLMYDKRGSLGMVNMRERAELVNGLLRIDSAEGKGTHIQIAIPLSEEAADRLRSRA